MTDPIIRRFEEFVRTLNRNDNFTLSQKRTLRNFVADVVETFITNTGANPPAELYGTSLRYGSVIWRTGLTFDVTPLGYYIDGNFYTHPGSTITLSAADGSNPRIDLFVADTSGNVTVVEGTPAADPVKPTVSEEAGQIEVSFVTVPAGATEPQGVGTNQDIYQENAGDPTEWVATAIGNNAATVTLASTADPFLGSNHIAFENTPAGSGVRFATTTDDNKMVQGTYDSLVFRLKAVDVGRRTRIIIQGYDDNSSPTHQRITLRDGTYGFDPSASGQYQTIAIPMSALNTYAAANVARVDVTMDGRGSSTLYIDSVQGIAVGSRITTIINQTIGLTEDELINNVRTFNVQQPFDNGTLTDGATVTWNLDSDPIANLTLGGNRTVNFTNARPGGTYTLKLVQDGTGSRTVTWDADIYWAAGTAPTLSTDANAVDVISFVAFEADKLYGVVAGQAFA